MSPQQTVDGSENVEKRKNVNNTRRSNRQAEKSSVKDYFVLFSRLCARSHTRARRMACRENFVFQIGADIFPTNLILLSGAD